MNESVTVSFSVIAYNAELWPILTVQERARAAKGKS